MNFVVIAAIAVLLLVACVIGLALMLSPGSPLKRLPEPEPEPLKRFGVRIQAHCKQCGEAQSLSVANRLRADLGDWRAGEYQRPCGACGAPISITVREIS